MLTILEVDDFWSPPDEGVRRITVEKIRTLEQRDDLRYVVVKVDHQRYAETRGRQVVIEHVSATKLPQLRPLTELIHRVHDFDAVWVADRIEASEASELGLRRCELVARDDFAGEVTKIRELVANLRAGLHDSR